MEIGAEQGALVTRYNVSWAALRWLSDRVAGNKETRTAYIGLLSSSYNPLQGVKC